MNILVITLRQVLIFVARIVRNALYTPYVTFLILYLFFVGMSVLALFFSNDAGISLIESFMRYIFSLYLFDPNGSYNFTSTDTNNFIVYCITGFAIAYEFITRAVFFFKKDFDHQAFQSQILKIIKIFYGITFVVSSIIFAFVFKEYVFAIALLFILLMNIVTLLLAYKVTSIFGFVIRMFEKIDSFYFRRVG